jgi:hypothetical protein
MALSDFYCSKRLSILARHSAMNGATMTRPPIDKLITHPNRELAISASHDGRIEKWDLAGTPRSVDARALDWRVSDIAFLDRGDQIAIAGEHHHIELRSAERLEFAESLPIGEEASSALAFAPDSRWIAIATNEEIRLVDRKTNQTRGVVEGGEWTSRIVFDAAIYHNQKPKGWRGNVLAFDVSTAQCLWERSIDAELTDDDRNLAEAGHPMGYFSMPALLPEGLLFGAPLGQILAFEPETGNLRDRFSAGTSTDVRSLAISSTRRALAGMADGSLRWVKS